MARIRTIKPEFPQSETIGRLSRDARLLFIQLWTISDDLGRCRGHSRVLASLLYPYDDDAKDLLPGWLDELEAVGAIRLYVVSGDTYLEICNWLKHQKIDKPSGPKCPGFDEGSPKPRESSTGDRDPDRDPDPISVDLQSTADVSRETPESEPLAKLRLNIPEPEASGPVAAQVREVFDYWRERMKSPTSKLSPERDQLIRKRLRDGYSVEDLKKAVYGCSVTPHNMGMNDRDTKFNGIEIIFRKADQVDRFIANSIRPPTIPEEYRGRV